MFPKNKTSAKNYSFDIKSAANRCNQGLLTVPTGEKKGETCKNFSRGTISAP